MKKIIVVIGAILLIGIIGFGVRLGLKGFGTGDGSGEGTQILLSNAAEKAEDEEDDADQTVIVKVDESDIFLNDEQCESVEELKEKISEINSKNKQAKFIFEHEYAIKATYDEVKKALVDFEEVLDIAVEYNE